MNGDNVLVLVALVPCCIAVGFLTAHGLIAWHERRERERQNVIEVTSYVREEIRAAEHRAALDATFNGDETVYMSDTSTALSHLRALAESADEMTKETVRGCGLSSLDDDNPDGEVPGA